MRQLLIIATIAGLGNISFASYDLTAAQVYACDWCEPGLHGYNTEEYDNFHLGWPQSTCGPHDCLHFVSQILQAGCMGVCAGRCGEQLDRRSVFAGSGRNCNRCQSDWRQVYRYPTLTRNVPEGLAFFGNNNPYWLEEGPFTAQTFLYGPAQGGPQYLALVGDVVIWRHPAPSTSGHATWVSKDEQNGSPWMRCQITEYNGLVFPGGNNTAWHCPPWDNGQYGCVRGDRQVWLRDIVQWYISNGYDRWFYIFHRWGTYGPPQASGPGEGTWRPQDGVREISQTLHVLDGTTLEMLPGVQVRFAAGARIVVDEGGALRVCGTTSQPVVFDEQTGGEGWHSLRIESTHPNNQLLNLVIRNAVNGIVVADGYADIQNVTVENCQFNGVVFLRSTGSLANSTIQDCGFRGVYIIRSGVSVHGNIISGNAGMGIRFWGNDYCELYNNVITENGDSQIPGFTFYSGIEVNEGAVSMWCNTVENSGGAGLVVQPQAYCDMGYHQGRNRLANNMLDFGQGIQIDYGQIYLSGGSLDINCGSNDIQDANNDRWLVRSGFDNLPEPGWSARWNYWGTTDQQNILQRISNDPVIAPLLTQSLSCDSPQQPLCPDDPQYLLFKIGWDQERTAQFDDAVSTYNSYLNQYPSGKYIAVVLDRIEFCKKSQDWSWPDIRAYFLSLAADSSKDSTLVALCKSNAAWCLTEMGDYQGAYIELDSLLDHTDKDYAVLTISLKMFLTQLQQEEIEFLSTSPGKKQVTSLDDRADALNFALDRADQRLDSLMRSLIAHRRDVLATVPSEFRLYQNYPNPFNSNTEIRFDLPEAANVELRVFNLLGQQVVELVNEDRPAGACRVTWDSKSVAGVRMASGVYVYQLKAGSFVEAKKMVLIK